MRPWGGGCPRCGAGIGPYGPAINIPLPPPPLPPFAILASNCSADTTPCTLPPPPTILASNCSADTTPATLPPAPLPPAILASNCSADTTPATLPPPPLPPLPPPAILASNCSADTTPCTLPPLPPEVVSVLSSLPLSIPTPMRAARARLD